MIKISKQADSLLLTYVPDGFNNGRWIDEKLRQAGKVTLRRTFTFTTGDLVPQPQQADDEDDVERICELGATEKLRHYADRRIQLDLDDGVKVNYGKFGDLLAAVRSVTGGAADD